MEKHSDGEKEHSATGKEPPEEKGLLFFGPVQLLKHPALFIEEKRKELGNVFKTTLAGHDVVIMCGNEALKYYYNEEYVTRTKPFSQLQKEIAGGGSLNVTPFLDGKDHCIRKNMMLKLVDRPSLEGYIHMLDEIYDETFRSWCSLPEIQIFHETKLLATHIIYRIIGGVNAQLVTKNAAACLEKMENYVTGLHTKFRVNLPGTLYGKAIDARNALLELFETQIRDFQQKIQKNERVPACFIVNMIKNVLPHHPLEIADQAREILHISLGSASFATPIVYLHLELPKHPHIIAKLKKEIKEFWDNKEDSITLDKLTQDETILDSIDRMQYVDRVVSEILRLYPYVTAFPATAKKDFVVEGFNVHEGAIVLAAFYSTNHDEKVYKEPDHFDPERWASPRMECEKATNPSFAFVPHGGGTPDHGHKCLGEQFIRYHWFTITYLITCTIWVFKKQKLEINWSHATPIPADGIRVKFFVTGEKEVFEHHEKLEGTEYRVCLNLGPGSEISKDVDIFITLHGSRDETLSLKLIPRKGKNPTKARFKVRVKEAIGDLRFIELEGHYKVDSPQQEIYVQSAKVKRASKWLDETKDEWTMSCEAKLKSDRQKFEVSKS